MKKIVAVIVILFCFPVISTADNWKELLKKKQICTDCEKKALLLGIGKYKNAGKSGLKNIRGPENDIIKIKEEFLMPVLFYRLNEILVLEDHEATKDNIISIMENWFLKGEDIKERFFYFSGHGSQVYDESGDEADGRDEVILSYNAEFDNQKALKTETVVMDDEIGGWFEKLRGKRLVAMFDSCHSGTMSRSVGSFQDFEVSTSRFVESAVRGMLNRETSETDDKPGLTEDNIPENHVYFYASRSFQPAKEHAFENGKVNGCFTIALITAVKNISDKAAKGFPSRDVSYMELFTGLDRVIKHEMNLEQTPDIQPAFRGTSPENYNSADSDILLKPFFTIPGSQTEPVNENLKKFPDIDNHKINILIVQDGDKEKLAPSDLESVKKYADTYLEKKDKTYHLYIHIFTDSSEVELSNMNNDLVNRFKYSDKESLKEGIAKRIRHAFLKDLLEKIKSEQDFPMSVKVLSDGKEYDRNDFYCKQEITYEIRSKAEAYIYMLSVDAGGELNLFIPFKCQKDNKIVKDGVIRILDIEKCRAACKDELVLETSEEPGEEMIKIIASPDPLNIRLAEEKGDYLSRLGFEETLNTIKDIIEQLKTKPVWYEGTQKYMNHDKKEYDQKFGKK